MERNILKKQTGLLPSCFIFFLLLGCASPMKVEPITNPKSPVKELVILSSGRFDGEIRKALLRQGFKVKSIPSQGKRTNKSITSDYEFNEAASRYGLRYHGDLSSNQCLTNGAAVNFSSFEFELIDIKENDTIVFVSKGGWTQQCTGSVIPLLSGTTTTLFDDLAAELAAQVKR
jgi:hypothetical protein